MKLRLFKAKGKVDEGKLDTIIRLGREAGLLDRKAWENQVQEPYVQSRELWSRVERLLQEMGGSDRELYKHLLKIARYAFSMGAIEWEIECKRATGALLNNNLALLNLEFDWLKENGYLRKDKKPEVPQSAGRP